VNYRIQDGHLLPVLDAPAQETVPDSSN